MAETSTLYEHHHIEVAFGIGAASRERRLTYRGTGRVLRALARSGYFENVVGADLIPAEALEAVVRWFDARYDRERQRHSSVRSVPVSGRAVAGPSFWTDELTVERSRVQAMRRRYQSLRDCLLRKEFVAHYYAALRAFRESVAEVRCATGRDLAREALKANILGA